MRKLHELREQRSQRIAEMQGIVATAEKENRDLSENEQARFDQLKTEVRGLDQQIERAETLAELERRAEADPITENGFAQLEQRVSILNVIRSQMEQRALTGPEAEYHREIERRTGRPAQGVYVPMRALETRVNLTTTAPEIVPVEHRPDLYIGPFRERLVARALGARVLTGLRGDLSIPKYGTGLSVGWVNENEAVPESNMGFESVGLTPHHVGGLTELSRQLIMQSSPDVEQLVRDDLAAVIAQAIDVAMINGGADPREPTGIMRTSGVLQGSLATPSWFEVLAMVGMLEDREIPGPYNWLVNAQAARVLRSTLKTPQGESYLLEGGRMGEIAAVSTGKVPNPDAANGTAILGDFSQIMLGVWSELDLLVNPYAEGPYRKGNVLVRGMATVDVAVRAPEAFVVADDVPLAAGV